MKLAACILSALLPIFPHAQGLKDTGLSRIPNYSKIRFGSKDSFKKANLRISNLDSLKNRKPSTKLNNVLPKSRSISFHGNATVDLYYADVQNPRQLNQNQYARLYFNPTISVLGLPFTTNVFLTTENNNFFNSNSISFRFDAQAYRRQLMEKYQKKFQEEQKNLGTKNTDLFKTDKLLEQQKGELEKEKQKLKVSDEMASKKLSQMKNEALQKVDDSLSNLLEDREGQFNDSLHSNKSARRIQKYRDSIDKIRSAQMKRIEELNRKLDEMQKHRDSVKEQIEYYKTQVDRYKQLAKDPFAAVKDIRANAEDSINKLANNRPHLSDIRQFDVGLFYANQTELTTAGLPVKGLNFLISPGKLIFGMGGGKTMSSFNSLTKTRQNFDRNAALLTLGYQFSRQLMISWNGGSLWDEIKGGGIKKSNFYSSLTVEHQFKQLQIKAEVAYSKIQTSGGYIENTTTQNSESSYVNYRLSDQLAYKAKFQYEILKNSSFSGSFTKVPLSYMTLGNPYMRRDYKEYEANYKQKLFKNKVQYEIFYKENKNNLNNFETFTTRAKGYGINIQTNFTSLPNLSLCYLPYSMGNNHPDSALRTRSQFSVLNAVLSYAYFRAEIMWNSLMMYSQSQAELAPGQLSGNVLFSSNQTLDYKGKININITCNASRFQYTTDTLNFNQCKVILGIKPSKTIQPQIGGDYVLYKNGASKSSILAGFNFRIRKSFSFRFNYSFSHLYRLWGFDEKFAHQAKGSLIFNW